MGREWRLERPALEDEKQREAQSFEIRESIAGSLGGYRRFSSLSKGQK
jgi:hypothetical protein